MTVFNKMTLLIYSENCKYCSEILAFVRSQPALLNLVRFHNINKQGVPNGLTRVPALVTADGATVIGGDVKSYLDALLPQNIESTNLNSRVISSSLDGTSTDNYFSFDLHGASLAPPMTKDLEDKISRNVQDAYKNIKN